MQKTNEMFKSLIINNNPEETDISKVLSNKNSYILGDNVLPFPLTNIQIIASSSLSQPSIIFHEKSSHVTNQISQNPLVETKSSQYISPVSSSYSLYDGFPPNALTQYQDNIIKYQTNFSKNNNIMLLQNSERPNPNCTTQYISNYKSSIQSNLITDNNKIDAILLQNPESAKIGFQNLIIPRFITNINPLNSMIQFQNPQSPKFIKKEFNIPENNHLVILSNPPADSTIVGFEPNERYQSPQNSSIFGSPTFKKVTSSKPIMKQLHSKPPSFEDIPDDLTTGGIKSNKAIENDFDIFLSSRDHEVPINDANSPASHKLEKKIGIFESSSGNPVFSPRIFISDRNYKPGLEFNIQKQKIDLASKTIEAINNPNNKQRKNE